MLAWDVRRLIKLAADLNVISVKLADIEGIDTPYWYDSEGDRPTCRSIVAHMQLVNAADLQYPIILSYDGKVMDGMHRVCKALLNNDKVIQAVQFKDDIPPDYIGVAPEGLPY